MARSLLEVSRTDIGKDDTMLAATLELTDVDFKEKTARGVSLIDFWAPWCGPCRMQGPVVDRIAAYYGDRATVAKVNVDDSPMVAHAFGVSSIPTIIILKDGLEVARAVGVQPEANLRAALDSALS